MKGYFIELHKDKVCPKCNSDKVGKKFSSPEETEYFEDYQSMYKCFDCNFSDYWEAFERTIMSSDGSEVCPKCGKVGKVKLSYYDWYSGHTKLTCTKCDQEADIEKFVGEERWEAFLASEREEAKKREAEFMRLLDSGVFDF